MTLASENENITYVGEDLEILGLLKRYRSWILSELSPYLHGDAVEIGAGIGSFSRHLATMVDRLEIIEPSANLATYLQSLFADDPAVTVHGMTAETWVTTAAPASRDVVVMINVLEHIEDDVAVLAELYKALRPDAHLLIFVPAMMALYSRLDAFYGHFRRYGRSELNAKVASAGFTVLSSKYMDVLGVLPWLVLNKWMGKTEFNAHLVHLYDRVGVPTTRLVERLMPFPFGKNIMLVARR